MASVFSTIAGFFTFSHIMVIVYALNILIALALIFTGSKTPTSTLAWIMIMFIVPVVGLILYLIFSQNIARMKINRMSDDEKAGLHGMISTQRGYLDEDVLYFHDNEVVSKWKSMIALNLDYSDALITGNDEVELIFDGVEMYRRLLEDIKSAKYTIKVCYYIVKDDAVGRAFINALTVKAREGVKVRLLVDALGSRSIGHNDLKEFKKAGGKYAFFFKPSIRHLFFRINYRNHRKIAVIDNEVGYLGGFNIAKEYLGLKNRFGYWRDTQMIVRGNALAALNERFYMDWRFTTKEKLDLVQSSLQHSYHRSSEGGIPIQIVNCGPESPKEEIKLAMMKMITNAKKSIYIQTPYLVPDETMIQALAMAARSGIDVRIMIPCMPDHPFVYRATLYNAGHLIAEGARVFIYDNGFLHAKTLSVDGEVCTVGTANFDVRSFRLNFETNAFIYDRNVTETMNSQFEKDMLRSHEYTLKDREDLSVWDRFAEAISRLLTEIL